MSNESNNITQKQIEEWVTNLTTGKFHYTKVMDGMIPRNLYPQLRVIMHRLRERGLIYPIDNKDGWWRPADTQLEEIVWQDLDGVIGDNLILPMGLHEYAYIPLPSMILVAGTYNAGKTCFAIQTVNLNIEKWGDRIKFFVSEGAELMKQRFNNLEVRLPVPAPFKMYRRTENFADVIDPDGLNVIDYLRVNMEQTYAVGKQLFEIFNKLKTGIAVVMMQKPPGERKLAFGGAATAFEPTFYISMDKGFLGFEKIKISKQQTFDPYHVKIRFKISKGVNFYDVIREVE